MLQQATPVLMTDRPHGVLHAICAAWMLQLQNPNSDETMVTWEQLSASSGMAPNTIRDCYKMMLPYMAQVSAALLHVRAVSGQELWCSWCIAGALFASVLRPNAVHVCCCCCCWCIVWERALA